MNSTEFTYNVAIPYEPGVTRRDPSPVIRADDQYHVWYSKALVDDSGYYASVWHATSPDGHAWTERGEAISRGGAGAWDENGVFTPTICAAGGQYFLYYTAVPAPFTNDDGGPNGTPTAIGVAITDSPDGPWRKFENNPLLRPGPLGDFDSHRLDDACLIKRDGKYWMYYKGREKGLGPGQTKMGLALAEHPTGPFVKWKDNPVLGSGHEVCVWPHGEGVAALVIQAGPEAETLQYSHGGLHFERQARLQPPRASGPFRADNFEDGHGPGITWGICHDIKSADRPFLLRFDCDLRAL